MIHQSTSQTGSVLQTGWMCLFSLLILLLAGSSSQAADHVVEIHKFKFVPDRLSVAPGDTVKWINRDLAPHTATAKGGKWDTQRLNKGEFKLITVTETMKLDYFCRFHPHMTAVLVLNSHQ